MVNKFKILKAFIFLTVTTAIIYAVVIVVLRISHNDFYELANKEFEIHALEEDIVPQGLDYCEEYNSFLISGYIYGDEQGKICVIDEDEKYRMVTLLDENGEELISHSGGVCHSGNFVYLAGCDGKCYVFLLEEIMDGKRVDVQTLGSFSVHNQAAFCCVKDDRLYVGEYYYFVKYRTDDTHHFVTPKGDENCAMTTVFEIDETEPLGVCVEPKMALSITGRAQGMCVLNDKILVLSTSGGFMGAQLRAYDYEAALAGEKGYFSIGEKEIPVYYLDSGNLINTIEILPKGEGITICENKLFVVFESASTRYKFGKFLDSQYVYSMPMEMLIEEK